MKVMEQMERPKSKLYALEPLVRKMPEVSVPKRRVSFKEKFMWTGIALLVFLLMTQIPLYGTPTREPFEDLNGNGVLDAGEPFTDLNGNGVWDAGVQEFFGQLRFVLASHAGSLMELGIGPIVTAGIIMQLLVGSKIIGLDLTNSEDRALFTGVQKFLALIMGLFEGAMLVLAWHYGVPLGSSAGIFILIQLTLGVIVVIYLDELVSKYGFGSGISLFILAGVATTVIWGAFNPIQPPYGAIPHFAGTMLGGGELADAFFRTGQLPSMMGLVATILIFFLVVYVENMRIEIPLAYGKFGGVRGRYPIRLLYASVIPVILAMVVFANINMIARVSGIGVLGTYDAQGNVTGGLAYYTRAPSGLASIAADPIHALVYTGILALLCMGFAWLWINMTGMGPRDVAQQLDRSGMLIPGFRRDIRVMERVLHRYIMTVALLGGAFVGLLSAGADCLGAIGSGTGILLAVSIMYHLYEEIAKERVADMFPAVRRFFGE